MRDAVVYLLVRGPLLQMPHSLPQSFLSLFLREKKGEEEADKPNALPALEMTTTTVAVAAATPPFL